ncbi:type IV toxin-antitoxin system AbiEi family antitoxin domain-containing protein [Brachybacterium halotolerans subsp. kimchii]|uniref:type IV toxin-antitoxin system AbiEi family antitoxin domain-containing protein n=1 Tax=Brachybacterium halotolerans TaxID=2795215 RepID=UPI001E30106D|nr:type IV toxin-antitoxin system AbiEi family antitoxin domain-containing protein [Brachybacterium halotolerans]UEJ82962.1 type IV toxin-antitoxin system AbiEi family antitoxin domain-containing protein [Brachybacterium halotolerans subsp. kimchii]
MTRSRSPLPRSLGAVFTTQQARAAGVSAQRLRAGDITTLSRGLYSRVGTVPSPSDVALALAKGKPRIVVCGPTAAEIWGLPLPSSLAMARGAAAHFSCETARTSSRLVRWHERSHAADETVETRGVRLTHRVRTWCDLAGMVSVDQLVHVADHLLRWPREIFEGRAEPYASRAGLELAIARWGRPWTAQLREALALARIGSDSPAETSLRLGLRRAGLPDPSLNEEIWDGDERLGEPDLHWEQWKVCVEHEGPTHLDREQQAKDIARTERRTNAGWIEVRTTAVDLRHGAARASRRTAEALRRHGWNGE